MGLSAGRYYHIEGTEKKDPAVAVPGGSDLDKVGFDAKRSLDMHLSFVLPVPNPWPHGLLFDEQMC